MIYLLAALGRLKVMLLRSLVNCVHFEVPSYRKAEVLVHLARMCLLVEKEIIVPELAVSLL